MAECVAIEVAEYIEHGLEFAGRRARNAGRVVETPGIFLDAAETTYYAGALGLALMGKTGDPQKALSDWKQVSNTSPAGKFQAAADLLGITLALARLIELNHQNGVPALEIAGGLRTGSLSLSFRRATAPARMVDSPDDREGIEIRIPAALRVGI